MLAAFGEDLIPIMKSTFRKRDSVNSVIVLVGTFQKRPETVRRRKGKAWEEGSLGTC